jgi:hypothetical protein
MLYDSIIPIGSNCRVAEALRDLNLRQHALPIDWTLSSGQAVLNLFKNDFEHFFDRESCQDMSFLSKSGKTCPWLLNTRYQISFIHEKEWSTDRVNTYTKRINALKSSLDLERVLLVRWDMKAPYHNDHNHVAHEKRDKEHYHQEDSLEYLYQLKDLCNKTYQGTIDLLILHADSLSNEDKRSDVFYYHIDANKAQKKGKAWDHIAIRKALKKLTLEVRNNPHKQSFLDKIKSWTY